MHPIEPYLRRIALALEQRVRDNRDNYHPPCGICGRTINLASRTVCDACGYRATSVAHEGA